MKTAAPSAATINRYFASGQLILEMNVAISFDTGWEITRHYFSDNQRDLVLEMNSYDYGSSTTLFQFLLIADATDEYVQRENLELDITSKQLTTASSRPFQYCITWFILGFTNIDGNGYLQTASTQHRMNYVAYPGQNSFVYDFGDSPVLMGNLDQSVVEPKTLYIHNLFVIAHLYEVNRDGEYTYIDREQGNIKVTERS